MSHTFCCERTLPFSAEQIFDLVADIERYPEFLDGWKRARIVRREVSGEATVLHVEQDMSVAGVPLSMRTRATLHRPHSLTIETEPCALVGLRIAWSFAPSGGGCRVRFEAGFTHVPLPLSLVLSLAFETLGPRIVSDFERRARSVLITSPE
jgi:coenzyme Q-binding protein COQ10